MPAALGRPTPAATAQEWRYLWAIALRVARAVPETLVLRDFHVDNLIRIPGRDGIAACGLLDFQDAVKGPTAYDLMSLLEDARRDIAPDLIADMRARYLAAFPALDPATLDRAMAVLGAQRHAKVIGIFTRLCVRDGKPQYLGHIARVWRLLDAACAREPTLAPIAAWLDAHVPRDAAHRARDYAETMTGIAPRRAMVLAAGLGLRMRPLTLTRPKPLVALAGRTLLDRALDALAEAGVAHAVVNTHYLGEMIAAHLVDRSEPRVKLSPEISLLETGGGVVNALPLLGDAPFFVVNADIAWTDGPRQALQRRHRAVEPEGVAVGDEERMLPQQGQRIEHAAAGFEQFGFVRKRDLAAAADP